MSSQDGGGGPEPERSAALPAGLDVAILHDPVPDNAPPDRRDTLTQADDVARALAHLGLSPRLVPFGPDVAAARRELTSRPPDLAVNLVESLAGLECLAFTAPALLDALDIPGTGSCARALLATARKSEAKRALRQAGLATPDWLSAPRSGHPHHAPGDPSPAFGPEFRFILKPELAHGSVGIGPESIVRAASAAELERLLQARSHALGAPCLAESFVPGREFSVAVIEGPDGPRALPPAEMRFCGPGAPQSAILCYASKWDTNSAAYADSRRSFPHDEPELLAQLCEAALCAWRVFGLAGYARFDYRVPVQPRGSGAPTLECLEPLCIDVNANPCLARDAGLAAAARHAGLAYEDLVAGVCRAALGWPGRPGGRWSEAESGWREMVRPGDPEAVRRLTEATGFFSAEEVVIAGELAQEHLAKGDASGYLFIFAADRFSDGTDRLAAYACFGPTPGTADSYDLYWIAVDPAMALEMCLAIRAQLSYDDVFRVARAYMP